VRACRGAALAIACALLASRAVADGGSRAVLAWPPTRYASAEVVLWRDVASTDPLDVHVVARGLDLVVALPEHESARIPLPREARCDVGVDACAITCERVAGTAGFSALLQSPDTAGVPDTLLLTAHDTVRIPPAERCGRAPRVLSVPASSAAEMPSSASVVTIVPVDGPAHVIAPATACSAEVDVVLTSGEAFTLSCDGEGADLSGLAFEADAPVLGISGNAVAIAPLLPGQGLSGDLVLDVAPDIAWSTAATTIVAPPLPRAAAQAGRGDVVRLLALADVSVRVRDDQGGDEVFALAAGATRDLDTAGAGVDRTLLVDADGALAAWHVPKSRAFRGMGDPAAVPLVPVSRFTRRDRVFIPDGYAESVALIVVTTQGSSVSLDGVEVAGFTPVASSDLAWASVALPPPAPSIGAVHDLDGDAPFGAWVVAQGGYKACGHAAAEAWPMPAPAGTAILRGVRADGLAPCATVPGRTYDDAAIEPLLFWSVEDPSALLQVAPCAAGACLSW